MDARLAALAAVLALVASGATAATGGAAGRVDGLATWVDVYDGAVYKSSEATAARIVARGVRTVFTETANDRARSTSSTRQRGRLSTRCTPRASPSSAGSRSF
jgi:hypothetical protein